MIFSQKTCLTISRTLLNRHKKVLKKRLPQLLLQCVSFRKLAINIMTAYRIWHFENDGNVLALSLSTYLMSQS